MEVLAAGVGWALNNVSPQKVLRRLGLAYLATNTSIPWEELSSRLSPEASIAFPGEPTFSISTSRWREWHSPDVSVVVRVQTEKDVQETIRYANQHGLPFVARSGGHGATEALADAKDAVLIDIRGLDKIQVHESGRSAVIGGGASVKQVVHDLWAAGKQTVTGICECVGFSAPVLGGGHGWLQGQYGLAADQVLSARLILPNGDAVTVSEKTNSDLFWALRGAGHNFGIVTEWDYRIYDIQNPTWSYEIFIFAGSKLEALLEMTNEMIKTQPPEVTHWVYILRIPEIDPDHPIIWYAVTYDGNVQQAREYAKPLHALAPMNVEAGEAPMPDLAPIFYMGIDGVGCAKGLTGLRFPIGLKTYNVQAVRKAYDEIDETIRRVPELAGSFFILESYANQGVQAIDEKSTSFPHRSDEILVTPYVMYLPNATIDPIAREFGEKLRGHLLRGSDDPERLRAYVNYAHGHESMGAIYGWEDWRLNRLRNLKAKWDPENKMRFYNPIV
ncbi:hypothetical protein BGZ63DRAFT_456033 [Mariannaea sp. PMI_226]|nr:hypothetical protein BGZ63DRAFT_456033 [Mariannaea sp. PMI_226]